MSYLNGEVLADLLVGDGHGETASQCPFVNRRVISWPPEPMATAAKYAIRGYLQAEDAVHERAPARAPVGNSTDPSAPRLTPCIPRSAKSRERSQRVESRRRLKASRRAAR
jgi:hypothetical protein